MRCEKGMEWVMYMQFHVYLFCVFVYKNEVLGGKCIFLRIEYLTHSYTVRHTHNFSPYLVFLYVSQIFCCYFFSSSCIYTYDDIHRKISTSRLIQILLRTYLSWMCWEMNLLWWKYIFSENFEFNMKTCYNFIDWWMEKFGRSLSHMRHIYGLYTHTFLNKI